MAGSFQLQQKLAGTVKDSTDVWLNSLGASEKKVLIKSSDFSNGWLYKLSNMSTHTINILFNDVSAFLKQVCEVDMGNAYVLALEILLIFCRVTDHGEANTEKEEGQRKSSSKETRSLQVNINLLSQALTIGFSL